jgi:hypothetical protein
LFAGRRDGAAPPSASNGAAISKPGAMTASQPALAKGVLLKRSQNIYKI